MSSITFTPELHHRPNEIGLHALMIRMTQNRKHKRKEIGYDIEKRHWNIKKKQVRSSHPLHVIINAAIKSKLKDLEIEYLKAIPLGQTLTMDAIAQKAKRDILGISYTEYYINYIKTEVKNGNTAAGMTAVWNKICRYKSEIYFEEITLKFLMDFQEHLRKDLNNNDTTVSLNMNYMSLVYNFALKNGVYVQNGLSPFWNMTLKKAKFSRTKLSPETIQKIQEVDLSKRVPAVNHARNIFCLCYYLLGVRISSMISMKWKNIQGNRCIYNAAKGEKKMDAIITKKAQEILELYRKSDSKPEDFIFPFLEPNTVVDYSNEFTRLMGVKVKRININLKTVGNILGLDIKITTHVARSSFAYNARKLSGGDIYAVQKALGHSQISTTEKYFSSDETIEADNLANLMFD